ncbi:MAG: glycoside hydrolase family 2 TIM barrel-domain containing protein [Bacilli bacterium]
MKTPLNFAWNFVPGFDKNYLDRLPESAKSVDLPHAPVLVPDNYFSEVSFQGLFTYAKTFDFNKGENELAFLVFDGVMLKVHPYLNGIDLGEKLSGWVSVSYDISAALKEKDNRLVVVVDSREDPLVPPFGRAVDYLTFAGIYRGVHLETRPKTYLKSFHAEGDKKGVLHVDSIIEGNAKDADVSYRLTFGGKLIKEFKTSTLQVPSVALWNLKTPYLYRLEATLRSSDGVDSLSLMVGFREAKFTPEGFFLNDEKIKLIGLNRHQTYPYVGPAMPDSAQREDADILKMKLGCSVVRTSHYPDSETFLSRCDEIGLLVIDEIPGWQYIGQDKTWRGNFQYFLEAMIEKERNHPSLIAYGTRIDESPDDDELYSKAVNFVHQANPSRQCLGVRNFKTSHCLEDVYAYNDFSCGSLNHGLDDPKTVKGAEGKPLLISEHNGHMFPTKQNDFPARRLEHALRHLKVMDDAYAYENLCGAIGWCAFDYNTHKDFGSGDHVCYHGVSDIYRNPKAAAFAYASQNSPLPVMWVANPPTVGDYDECLCKPLYVFTNCDYVEMYKNDKFVEVFKPDLKEFPHLPHAPIVIDDYIGALINPEPFSIHDRSLIKELLNYVGRVGIAHVQKKDLAKFYFVLKRNHLDFDKLTSLYGRYIANSGLAVVYDFKGFKEGKLVCEKKYGPSTEFSYRYETSAQALQNGDTYDVARVSIKYVDEWGSQLHYAHNVLSFKTLGPIEVIGPKTVSLIGGDISVYVRSLAVARAMDARLIIVSDQGDHAIDFTVE